MSQRILAIVAELRDEKHRLDEAITCFERIAKDRARKGRPPKDLVDARKKKTQNGSSPKRK